MFFTHTLKRFLYVIFSVFLRFITQSLIHQCKLIILQTEQAECFEIILRKRQNRTRKFWYLFEIGFRESHEDYRKIIVPHISQIAVKRTSIKCSCLPVVRCIMKQKQHSHIGK